MSLASVLVPPLLLMAGAVVSWGLGVRGVPVGGVVCAAAGWLALALLVVTWFAGGGASAELAVPVSVGAAPLGLRVDPVVVVFELAVLVPLALLLTFQPRGATEAALAALAGAAALTTLEAGSLGLTAFGFATCVSLLMLSMFSEEPAGDATHALVALGGASLLLAWAAVVLELAGGTSVFGAVPVTALRVPVFVLLALAAVLGAGLTPWRSWVTTAWARRRLAAAVLAVALMVPLAFSLLVRAYLLGAGQWPSPWLHLGLAALGAAVALGAAMRAQAASERRGHLAEMVPLGSGLVLLALALGTPLGAVAALTALLALGVVAGAAPLLSGDARLGTVLTGAVLVGMPPALGFGGWLLSIQAALEASAATGFVGLAGAGAWLLGVAAAARAVRLRPGWSGAGEEGSRTGTLLALGLALASGVGLGGLVSLLSVPAAAELVLASRAARLAVVTGGFLGVNTPSGGWSAAILGGSLVAVGLAAVLALRWWSGGRGTLPALVVVQPGELAPLFPAPLGGISERALRKLAGLRVPEEYRSLFRPWALEAAAGRSRPWFWVAVTMALLVVVTR